MKILSFFVLLATAGFAENLILDNQSTYPNKQSRLEIQWASTAKEVEEGSRALVRGIKLSRAKLQSITQLGQIKLKIPNTAGYFRVLAWKKGSNEPDLLTNWVEVVPDKTYILETDHLFPAVLMCGSGC